MKKQITTIALGVLMIAGAMAMYAGDTVTFKTNLTSPVYTVLGNMSSLEGLNITFDGDTINISTELNYKPDNFTLIFFDNQTREVVKTVYRGGGGTSIRYVDNNVTVYVPEYINNTETTEVEVEKIVDKIVYVELGYELWHVTLSMLIGVLFTWLILRTSYSKKR